MLWLGILLPSYARRGDGCVAFAELSMGRGLPGVRSGRWCFGGGPGRVDR